MKRPIRRKQFQSGFTLIEVLLALIVFSLSFFFTTQFFKMIYSNELLKDDRVVRLAINEMESVISQKDFQPLTLKNTGKWKIETRTEIDNGFVMIEVNIFSSNSNSRVYQLKTYRINN